MNYINLICLVVATFALNGAEVSANSATNLIKAKTLKINAKNAKNKAPSPQDELQSFSNKTLLLEQAIDQHATNVQLNHQRLIESSQIDHMLHINAKLKDVEDVYFRTLELKLDDFPLFSVHEGTGLWTPVSDLPLYNGPVTPGDHEIKISAKASHQADPGNELAEHKLSSLEESIKFTVSLDEKQKNISLTIAKSDDGSLTLIKQTAP